ncbi:hypothetical protein EYC80_002070 [Monilinia laxa]|uniref:U6 small nuclear RNA (adenine-(43)-N(6))-methyltransferase n=1 Tax=Monilinia laxa TaxID=61186 RepID=A0A5N6K6Y8_MONLA|nr:hypothetical protein EYC80_002070 [Monilinia laxa]
MSTTTNIYKEDIDFVALGREDSDFGKLLNSNGQLDFSDPKSVQQLTKSLLKRDFGLKLILPDDRLCPPVPNRLNYILWLQDLVDTSSDTYTDSYRPDRQVHGLDIGTGASCIYPLLGCTQRPLWKFTGTAQGPLIPLDEIGFDSLDFTLCNPPFYIPQQKTWLPLRLLSSVHHLQLARAPTQRCLSTIIEQLKENKVDNYAVTEFVQGSRTRRWAVAWSFGDRRPSMNVSRGCGSLQKSLLPFPAEQQITIPASNKTTVARSVHDTLSESMTLWTWDSQNFAGVGFCDQAVWSRKSRRGRENARIVSRASGSHVKDEEWPKDMAFGFKISLEEFEGDATGSHVIVRWVKGHNSVLFESFCGMMKRKLSRLTGALDQD